MAVRENVLVTGGAGFIGSFVVDELVKNGHRVRILDNLEQQVHRGRPPVYLNRHAELLEGDMRAVDDLQKALQGIDVVFHLAAAVGVGQSMHRVSHYVHTNTLGTANLLDLLVNSDHKVRKVIVAASMSSYGEGSYACSSCGIVYPPLRTVEQMSQQRWELYCPDCESILTPTATDESKPQRCNTIYAFTKKSQEDMALLVAGAYGIPTVAARFFNVYGPRQSLSNPYTGVAAIFVSRIKNGNQPVVYEDGLQTRDFISVHDVVRALVLMMDKNKADYEVFNVGSGTPVTIKSVAEKLAQVCGSAISPAITGEFRKGDVRHCYADITKIQAKLGFRPETSFEQGVGELIEWSRSAESVDMFETASGELKRKGLLWNSRS